MTESQLIGRMLAMRPCGSKLRWMLDVAAREGFAPAEVTAAWLGYCAALARRRARAAAYGGWQHEREGFVTLPHRPFGAVCLRAVLAQRRAARALKAED